MNCSRQKIKKTLLASAIAVSLGTTAIPWQASAEVLNFDISGWLSLGNPDGTTFNQNFDEPRTPPYFQYRTPVNGTMTFDTDTNSGTLEILPHSFFGGGDLTMTNITFQDIDGPAGAATLLLGNMSASWNANTGVPVSIVWDGAGMLDAISQGLVAGNTIASTGSTFACDTNIGCALPASDDFLFDFGGKAGTYTLPIGASPMVTTTFDTTDIGIISLGINPSGTLPLVSDAVGGSPMKAGPFPGFNFNYDFDRMTLVSSGQIGSASIGIPGGDTQECTDPEGKEVSVNVETLIPDDDAVDTVSWELDGAPVATGDSVLLPASLGSHTVFVTVTTMLGRAFSDTANITVVDTTAPVIGVAFVDKKTGTEITTISNNKKAKVSIDVSDACDDSPSSIATAGLPVTDGDKVKARISRESSDDSDNSGDSGDSDGSKGSNARLAIKASTDNIKITVTARDASGNRSSAMTTLRVIP